MAKWFVVKAKSKKHELCILRVNLDIISENRFPY